MMLTSNTSTPNVSHSTVIHDNSNKEKQHTTSIHTHTLRRNHSVLHVHIDSGLHSIGDVVGVGHIHASLVDAKMVFHSGTNSVGASGAERSEAL